MQNELLDQLAHFFVGAFIVWALTALHLSFFWAFTFLMTGVFIRELSQHEWNWKFIGPGSILDMVVFAIGGWVGGFTL